MIVLLLNVVPLLARPPAQAYPAECHDTARHMRTSAYVPCASGCARRSGYHGLTDRGLRSDGPCLDRNRVPHAARLSRQSPTLRAFRSSVQHETIGGPLPSYAYYLLCASVVRTPSSSMHN